MPIPDDLIQQLGDVIQLCHAQRVPRGTLLEDLKALVDRIYSSRPGAPAKYDRQMVFDEITKWRSDEHARAGRWPKKPQIAKYIEDKFRYSKPQAKVLARIYYLWNVKGYILLTPPERAFLKENASPEWCKLEDQSKFIAKAFAAVREAESLLAETRKASAEHAKRIGRRTQSLPKPQGRPGKLIKTAEEIFRLLDKS